ncbi:MAG: sigma-70 family RNA polymerase sigma factor [Lachnospiraceae bacterium]|jgi:RNA polymerase sigma-70 factor (ECF subfamily)|nr:sigma-70 family RNA polymerase sigma factor [Lachnospiraceae bacterium]
MRKQTAQDIKGVKQNIKVQDKKILSGFIEKCYQLYEQKMYQAAYRILQDSGWAEDAVQEAFLKLMKGRVYFEDACSDDCKKYIITVIRHSAIDIYNKKKREQEMFCFCEEALYRERAAQHNPWGEDVDVRGLIASLRPQYLDVVDCLAVKNLSVKETAERLGISEANVRKRFERAKRKLKQAK